MLPGHRLRSLGSVEASSVGSPRKLLTPPPLLAGRRRKKDAAAPSEGSDGARQARKWGIGRPPPTPPPPDWPKEVPLPGHPGHAHRPRPSQGTQASERCPGFREASLGAAWSGARVGCSPPLLGSLAGSPLPLLWGLVLRTSLLPGGWVGVMVLL